jgi:hypothetical protein
MKSQPNLSKKSLSIFIFYKKNKLTVIFFTLLEVGVGGNNLQYIQGSKKQILFLSNTASSLEFSDQVCWEVPVLEMFVPHWSFSILIQLATVSSQ